MTQDYKILIKSVNYNRDGTIKVVGIKQGTNQQVILTCTAEDLCQSTLKANNSTNTTLATTTLFKLTDIPNAMRKQGWNKAAYLNEKWLNGNALEMSVADKGRWNASNPSLNYYDPNIFDHYWLKNFDRYNDAIEHLKRNVITPKSESVIIERLDNNGSFNKFKFRSTSTIYGESNYQSISTGNDCQLLHKNWQVQFVKVDSGSIDKGLTYIQERGIDDLWATFGSFAVYSAIADYSVRDIHQDWYEIQIKSIVCYVIDSYDFISQPNDYLGHWSKTDFEFNFLNRNRINHLNTYQNPRTGTISGSFNPNNLLYPVYNSHYVAYRKKYNKGRDMVVWTKPQKFDLRAMEEKYHTFRIRKSLVNQ